MMEKLQLQLNVIPDPVLVQPSRGIQRLNFDLWIHNHDVVEWVLRAIELRVYDKNHLIMKRRLDENGLSPSIDTLPQRKVPPNDDLYIFNPFPPFDQKFPLARLICLLDFTAESGEKITLDAHISPKLYQQKVKLFLPLKGRILVSDGHDYYAHHRRVPLVHPLARWLGLTALSGRYAWDFMLVDQEGNTYRGAGLNNEAYWGFAIPVLAPAEGTVVSARNDVTDNLPGQYPLREDFETDPSLFLGNCIIIDHGNGEYSALVHCQRGSVLVKAGDTVKQCEEIAKMGNSGDTYRPHLHYQLMNGTDFRTAEGLPACFSDFDVVIGSGTLHIPYGSPETGEILVG